MDFKVSKFRGMEVTVFKSDGVSGEGKKVATYHDVKGIGTILSFEGELCFVLFLRDEPDDLWPTFPCADYNLHVE